MTLPIMILNSIQRLYPPYEQYNEQFVTVWASKTQQISTPHGGYKYKFIFEFWQGQMISIPLENAAQTFLLSKDKL